MPQPLTDRPQIAAAVTELLTSQPIIDIHTHIFAPSFGTPAANSTGRADADGLMLWGIDELLTYHYLVAEVFRVVPPSRLPYEEFWRMSKREQASHVWKHLFVERTPLSEACRGVVTSLSRLGLDPNTDSLDQIRRWYGEQDPDAFVDRIMELSNVEKITMTNEVFDRNERARWLADPDVGADARFDAVLRIDPMILNWDLAATVLNEEGYSVDEALSGAAVEEARRFLRDWIRRMKAVYLAVSLPPDWRYPAGDQADEAVGQRVLDQVILPVCRELGLPFAMMIGVRRGVNRALRGAGDMGARSDIWPLTNLIAAHPDNKFLVTMISRENQQELCAAARKFGNLMIFGCWWFLNNPSLVEEVTRLRLELLGTSFIPQHSDARVLEQIPYKWEHSREVIGRALVDKYDDLVRSGWRLTREQIDRDIRLLLHDNWLDFLRS